jgi:hypothetical protein
MIKRYSLLLLIAGLYVSCISSQSSVIVKRETNFPHLIIRIINNSNFDISNIEIIKNDGGQGIIVLSDSSGIISTNVRIYEFDSDIIGICKLTVIVGLNNREFERNINAVRPSFLSRSNNMVIFSYTLTGSSEETLLFEEEK